MCQALRGLQDFTHVRSSTAVVARFGSDCSQRMPLTKRRRLVLRYKNLLLNVQPAANPSYQVLAQSAMIAPNQWSATCTQAKRSHLICARISRASGPNVFTDSSSSSSSAMHSAYRFLTTSFCRCTPWAPNSVQAPNSVKSEMTLD